VTASILTIDCYAKCVIYEACIAHVYASSFSYQLLGWWTLARRWAANSSSPRCASARQPTDRGSSIARGVDGPGRPGEHPDKLRAWGVWGGEGGGGRGVTSSPSQNPPAARGLPASRNRRSPVGRLSCRGLTIFQSVLA